MESLIPDILFTLLGHKSEVLQSIVDYDYKYNTDENLIVNTGDRQLLIRFLDMAEKYQKLNTLITSYNRLETINRKPDHNGRGMYYEAFVNGMFIALQPYRKCISDIEKELSNNKQNKCILAEILVKVEHYKPLIFVINNILENIDLPKLHGGQILSTIYEEITMKFIDDKVQLTFIFKQCLQVLISQLNTFFECGVIFDPCKEFFIEAQNSKTTQKFKYFSIVPSLMPSFVNLSTADKITKIGDVIKTLSYAQDQSSVINYKHVSLELYGPKKDELFTELSDLNNRNLFTKSEFVRVIDKFYTVVDNYMFKVSFSNNSFCYYIKLVRDFYLLGNGEFYLHFLNKMCSLSLTSEHSLRAIKVTFMNTAREVKLHKSMYKLFTFSSLENKETDETTWTKLKVSMETKWPLQFIFTSIIQNNYSKLLVFLSRVKQVQMNLHKIWIEKKSKSYEMDSCINQLTVKLIFLIDTLYSYLQLDVIEDEYFLLSEKLSHANDFQTIWHLHSMFQVNIMRDSFLFMEDVYMDFNRILDACGTYCIYMTDITAALNPHYKHCLDELQLLFTDKPNKLKTILNTIKDIYVTPKPNQFIVRLNYNKWLLQAISIDDS